MQVATTPARTPYIPWYIRWELPMLVPGVLLALVMLWSVVQSIATSNWAEGLEVLVGVAVPALLVGVIFARLHWLPGWLAHMLSAALGIAWSIQRIGPLLVDQIALELDRSLADRLVTWGDRATEILIRVVVWGRILQAGGRGEDIVLFVVALALLIWALGYATGWLLFRSGWAWWAVVLNAMMILVNYTFAMPKPNALFFLFLGTALLLIVHQNVTHHQERWRSALVEYPAFMPWRFLLAAALFCGLVVLVTSVLPSNISSVQVARVWRTISAPLTALREGWDDAFSTINAPPGSGGGGFVTRSVRVGGPRALGDAVVMKIRSAKYDYWRVVTFDRFTGRGWESTVGERARSALGVAAAEFARSPVEPGMQLPQIYSTGRLLVTQTVELAQSRSDNLLPVAGQFASSSLPTLLQHGYLTDGSGQTIPNLEETSAVFAQVPLQQSQVYTVTSYVSTIDEQSLREAGTDYPEWVANFYTQLPETVTERTRARAREIVQQAGATTPYDQAVAIQNYLRTFVYDTGRQRPPDDQDWVDYFVFDAQRGYCDDFATAMVVMLRSLDLPARWSQGFAGGRLDPEANAYEVRESVQHTWPEVYFPRYGWQRFEPTPASYASMPARPAQPDPNADEVNGPAGGGVDDALREQQERERAMGEDILPESSGDLSVLQRLVEERERQARMRQLVIAGGVAAALLAGVALFFLSLRRELTGLSPARAAYARLLRLAAWAGVPQEPYVTPHEYANQLGRTLPARRQSVDRIVDAYVVDRYSQDGKDGQTDSAELEQDWQAVRGSLLGRLVARLGAAIRPQPPANQRRRQTKRRRI